jgi:hypothetical protein
MNSHRGHIVQRTSVERERESERVDIYIYETVVETGGGGGGPLAFSPATIDREMYGCMDVCTVCMHAMLQYTTVLTLPRSLC